MVLAPLDDGWAELLSEELHSEWMRSLERSLDEERSEGIIIHPPKELTYNALNSTPLKLVRAVILGQDPYHGPGQAMGLSFSVPRDVSLPPSLRNIFKELRSDLGVPEPSSGDLSPWAKRGVLLLNTALTVRSGEAGSHSAMGWEQLTDRVISLVSERRDHVAFILWGRHAEKKAHLIDGSKHLILISPHPSPLSARRGFFGSRPFSKTNAWLQSIGADPIDWML